MILRIEPATPGDVPLILSFIRKLAEYEQLPHKMVASEQDLTDALFGPRPAAEALIAHLGDKAVGLALYFEIYSTYRGRRGIFLEDLYVEEAYRGAGIGKRLLAAVARTAQQRGGWLQWLVLGGNDPAIGFYRRLGAEPVEEWSAYRLEGEALVRLAESF